MSPAFIDIVFDGPPGPESGRFIEVEDPDGKSLCVGEWVSRPDGWWALRLWNPSPETLNLSPPRPEAEKTVVIA